MPEEKQQTKELYIYIQLDAITTTLDSRSKKDM